MHGKNLIAGHPSSEGPATIQGTNPTTGVVLDPVFHEATAGEIDRAARQAAEAAIIMRGRSAQDRADLLDAMADAIEAAGDRLVERVMEETGLPEGRVRGERGRTTGQLRLFASVVREGSWVDARIDLAQPDRAPIPKPDVRRMLVPIGPVAVFGASNFPLAFSVAGGDTASALAAGCPVVVKAHPAHPGTSELVAEAINSAVEASGFPPGTFSLIHGARADTGQALVQHPAIQAVGFTGSLRAGRSLFDTAASRPTPIPVFAEMGSVNPVFVLPDAMTARGEAVAEGLAQSVMLGSGQFCTNPGLVFATESPAFLASLEDAFSGSQAQVMLHAGILEGYRRGLGAAEAVDGVQSVATAPAHDREGAYARPAVMTTSATTFMENPVLHEEIFGPATLVVLCADEDEMADAAEHLSGNLTATLHAEPDELARASRLAGLLEDRVGRLILNSYPTGVEVCPSMHHGGPYPATTDSRSTSVGTAAITRFARPMCWQGFPQSVLPDELLDANPRGVMRMVDGVLTRGAI